MKSTPGARSTVAGATAGDIRLVLKSGSRNFAPRPTSFVCNTNEVNKMEYLIAFSVVATMGLYVVTRAVLERT